MPVRLRNIRITDGHAFVENILSIFCRKGEVIEVGVACGGDYVGRGAEDADLGADPCSGYYLTCRAESGKLLAVETVVIGAFRGAVEADAQPCVAVGDVDRCLLFGLDGIFVILARHHAYAVCAVVATDDGDVGILVAEYREPGTLA